MAKQTINIGASANDGSGDPLRIAFDKINDNFTELYNRDLNTDAQTLTLAGNTLSIAGGNSVELDISPTGDLTGSVFGDDSTVLVDGVNSKINLQNTVLNNTISTSDEVLYLNTASTSGERGSRISTTDSILDIQGAAALPGGQGGGVFINGGIPFDDPSDYTRYGDIIISGRIVSILAGDGEGGGGLAIAGPVVGTTVMDIKGSVFGDDSTVLVDGVNGSIPYSVISNVQVTESDLLVDFAPIVATQIQTNGLPNNTRFSQGAPATSIGIDGDLEGSVTFDDNYIYYCTDAYDGVTNIWKRVAWSGDTW